MLKYVMVVLLVFAITGCSQKRDVCMKTVDYKDIPCEVKDVLIVMDTTCEYEETVSQCTRKQERNRGMFK